MHTVICVQFRMLCDWHVFYFFSVCSESVKRKPIQNHCIMRKQTWCRRKPAVYVEQSNEWCCHTCTQPQKNPQVGSSSSVAIIIPLSVDGLKSSLPVCWGVEVFITCLLRCWSLHYLCVEVLKSSLPVCWGAEVFITSLMRCWLRNGWRQKPLVAARELCTS